ncbi:MAG: PorV/PorQ family protein [Gemmatimonadota bacterium]|nr:MAG: PorV/PorQ family protein [Gemmatimonadota bacterium]
MKRKMLMSLAVLMASGLAHGQLISDVSKVGTTAASFLEIGIGSRAVAMGGAFVAVADDATALYWNPGGLSRLPSKEVALVHTEWLAEINFDFAGFVLPLGQFGSLGASITSLSMSDMKVRTIDEPEGTGEMFGAGDIALGVSYAKNLTDRFSIGFSGKYIQQKIWHMKASSVAFDIGTLFTTQFNDMKIGMSISNFGNKMRLEGKDTMVQHDIDPEHMGNNDRINAHLDTDRWSLPLVLRVGVAMDVLERGNNRLTIATDALHPNDNTESLNLGGEYVFNDLFFLRLGYKALFLRDSEQGLTAGAGLSYTLTGDTLLKIDYAYADFNRLNNVQRFSLGIEF